MVDYPITQNVGLGADGKFTGGNPSTGQSASRLSAAWMNAVTDELLHVLRAAGLNPDEMDSTQLLAAIRKLVWSPDQIPELDAAKISSGAISLSRLPEIPASKITSGVFSKERIPRQTAWWDVPGIEVGQIITVLCEPEDAISRYPLTLPCNGAAILIINYPEYANYYAPNGQSGRTLTSLANRLDLKLDNGTGTITLPDFSKSPFFRLALTDVGRYKAGTRVIMPVNYSYSGSIKPSFNNNYESEYEDIIIDGNFISDTAHGVTKKHGGIKKLGKPNPNHINVLPLIKVL